MFKFIFILCLSTSLFASEPIIKSLQYFANRSVHKIPIIKMGTNDKLTISFDIEAKNEPSFSILFKFCDADWNPYENLLLEGISENIDYNINLDRLPLTTQGAEYRFEGQYPRRDVKFKNSGKWMFFIIDPFDDEIIYDWGKFFVIENQIKLNTEIKNWRIEGRISSNNANDRVKNIKTSFVLPDSLEPFRVHHVEIIKNKQLEYPTIISKDAFQKNKGFEWDGTTNFEFIARDIEPGNEYRQVNLNDRNKYSYPNTRAHFDGIQYSRFYKLGKKDLNGSFSLMNKNNEYSDYLVTQFEFKPHEEIYEDIFIVGSFTNWEVLPWYILDFDDDIYSINLELKRGRYDYQYVKGILNGSKVENIDWNIFEGNFWDTENVYSIFLYYKSPEKGEYDKIIGFKQIVR